MPSTAGAALFTALHFAADEPSVADCNAPALRHFAVATFEEAAPLARAIYDSAARCPRCRRVLAHLFDRLGSTIFRDDDPRSLARAFDAADRDACTVRLLAACIVMYGRDRVRLH
jgi:hypothetical protein